MARFLFVLLISLAFASCTMGNIKEPHAKNQHVFSVCSSIMNAITQSDYSNATELLKKHSVINEDQVDTLGHTIQTQLTKVQDRYGKMLGYEYVQDFRINDKVVRQIYILKFEEYFLKCAFTSYRGSRGWVLTSFLYNDVLEDAFEYGNKN
jgi:hypothetical protein